MLRKYLVWAGVVPAIAVVATIAIRPMYWLGSIGFGWIMFWLAVSVGLLLAYIFSRKAKTSVKPILSYPPRFILIVLLCLSLVWLVIMALLIFQESALSDLPWFFRLALGFSTGSFLSWFFGLALGFITGAFILYFLLWFLFRYVKPVLVMMLTVGIVVTGILLYQSAPDLTSGEVKTIMNMWLKSNYRAVSVEYRGEGIWRVRVIGTEDGLIYLDYREADGKVIDFVK